MIGETLLLLLAFSLPTQFGTFFFFDFSFVQGVRVDYLAPALFLTDILVFILLASKWKLLLKTCRKKWFSVVLLILVSNVLLAQQTFLALYGTLKVLELYGLSVLVKNSRVKRSRMYTAFFAGAVVVFFLALAQIVHQGALQGIWYFLGERNFTIDTIGIATITAHGKQLLRPYSTFPHPNALGGFYLALYVFALWDTKTRSAARFLLMIISSLLILISFSRTAIIVFAMINMYYAFDVKLYKHCVFCFVTRLLTFLLVLGIAFQFQGDPLSLYKRGLLTKKAVEIISTHPFFGVGLKNYLFEQGSIDGAFPYVFIQPVHNVFLLFVAEVGVVVSGLLACGAWKWLKKRTQTKQWWIVLFVVVATGMFDHYWLTIQQNFLLLAVLFGLLNKDKV
ncbi:O-antigen ligase family protein [Candidatus Woesebacteria bacterium]|nr:O-antigen ligase family protein [Candidatus Woesebacteria bacterium]